MRMLSMTETISVISQTEVERKRERGREKRKQREEKFVITSMLPTTLFRSEGLQTLSFVDIFGHVDMTRQCLTIVSLFTPSSNISHYVTMFLLTKLRCSLLCLNLLETSNNNEHDTC